MANDTCGFSWLTNFLHYARPDYTTDSLNEEDVCAYIIVGQAKTLIRNIAPECV